MGNIAYIGPGGAGEMTPPGEALNEAVEILEELLAEARSGKLRAVAVAAVIETGVSVTKREFAFKGGSFADLYIATDQLIGRMRRYVDEGS